MDRTTRRMARFAPEVERQMAQRALAQATRWYGQRCSYCGQEGFDPAQLGRKDGMPCCRTCRRTA